jgi:hypothetical protein
LFYQNIYQEVNVMMSPRLLCLLVIGVLAVPAFASEQTYAPWVTLSITTPDGQTLERTARDSAVASVTLNDGTIYELRPTIHDEPFSKVTIAIFKAPTATESTTMVGEVQVTKGGAAVDSKTRPNFKIAVPKIEAIGPKQTS